MRPLSLYGQFKLGKNGEALSKSRWIVSVDRRFPEDLCAFERVCEINDFEMDDIPSFLESRPFVNNIYRLKKAGKGKLNSKRVSACDFRWE